MTRDPYQSWSRTGLANARVGSVASSETRAPGTEIQQHAAEFFRQNGGTVIPLDIYSHPPPRGRDARVPGSGSWRRGKGEAKRVV